MSVTTLEGIIENGQVRLPAGTYLPERAKVFVIIPNVPTSLPKVASPRLVHPERAEDFKKEVIERRPNASL